MSRQSTIKLIILILLLLVLVISIATKAAHWDKVTMKGYAKDIYDEVYPGMEGTIAIDAILFVGFALALLFHFKPNPNFTKYLLIFLIVVLLIRVILALLFLAGDHEYCRKQVDYCNDYGETRCYNSYGRVYCSSTYCAGDWYKTLKGAWVFEIIAFILVNIFAVVTMFMIYKGINS